MINKKDFEQLKKGISKIKYEDVDKFKSSFSKPTIINDTLFSNFKIITKNMTLILKVHTEIGGENDF